jgi:glyoxylase I family protein
MTGTNNVLGGGGFHHVAVRVADFDAAVKFYGDVLGFEPKVAWGDPGKRAVMLDTGKGDYLEVFEGDTVPPASGGAILHYAVRCTDVDSVIDAARSHGCEVTVEPKDVTIQNRDFPLPVRIAFFTGPAGEQVELFKNELT